MSRNQSTKENTLKKEKLVHCALSFTYVSRHFVSGTRNEEFDGSDLSIVPILAIRQRVPSPRDNVGSRVL